MTQWAELFLNLEAKVVKGEHPEVESQLGKIAIKEIPREYVCRYGELAWRINSPFLTLKILRPVVFPENPFAVAASGREKYFYALALVNLGASDEALALFDTINENNEPDVLLGKALAYFRTWDYQESLPYLRKYIQAAGVTEYKRLIGKVNLAAALICVSKCEEGRVLIQEIQTECKNNSYFLLLGNSFELLAQIEIFQSQFNSALKALDQAWFYLKDQNRDYSLYIEKWRRICECLSEPSEKNIVSLRKVKSEAKNLLQWETVRECDLFEAVATKNIELAKKVIMGTPFDSYRARVRKLVGIKIPFQGHYTLKLVGAEQGTEERSGDEPQNFSPYEKYKNGEGLFEKPLLLALFEALSQDFYKPSHIGLLFQRIYREEKFNPDTSPDRVLKLMKRLNIWFEDAGINLTVTLKKSEFMLTATSGQSVNVLVQRAHDLKKDAGQMSQLRSHFKNKTFSSQQVADKLGISSASARRMVKQALSDGYLNQLGKGRSTVYQLCQKQKSKKAA